jgi:V8-like Glu-specific endopeptidase
MSNSTSNKGRPVDGDPSPEGSSGNIQTSKRSLELATAELWTTAELLEAEPYPLPEPTQQEIERALDELASGGPAASAPQAMKDAEGSTEAGGQPVAEGEGQADEAPTATTGGYDYPPPYTRYEIFTPYTTYPYATVGKLFFVQGGRRFVCSAASVGNNGIWTAGHCVHSGNNRAEGWATEVVFVPAYRDGAAPFGQWPASWLATRTAWYQNGIPNGLSQDMGGAILHPQSGRRISQAVGWLGFAWNWSKYQHWNALGYPAAAPFNGQRMNVCQASFAYNGNVTGVKPNGIGCDMTGGCSGGPWVRQFGTGNFLNGNNSYRLSNRPEELYSPHFNNDAKSLKDLIVAGTP